MKQEQITTTSYAEALRNQRNRPVVKPPPQNLTPVSTVLVDWDALQVSSLQSVMPEEGEQRSYLVEEYLWEYLQILKEKHQCAKAVHDRERHTLLLDEAEERRFIEEDGDHLALRGFLKFTVENTQDIFMDLENSCRTSIFQSYMNFMIEALSIWEDLHRMHIVIQAFDSVFLKLCQVNPFWMWRKLKFVEELATEEKNKKEQLALWEEQGIQRQKLIGDFNQWYAVAVEMLAMSEKAELYQRHMIRFTDTCHLLMVDAAVKIQSCFRGFRVRRAVRLW